MTTAPSSTAPDRPDLTADVCRAPTVRTRRIGAAISAAILGVGVALLLGNGDYVAAHLGEDFQIYLRHARDWLAGGSFYDAPAARGTVHASRRRLPAIPARRDPDGAVPGRTGAPVVGDPQRRSSGGSRGPDPAVPAGLADPGGVPRPTAKPGIDRVRQSVHVGGRRRRGRDDVRVAGGARRPEAHPGAVRADRDPDQALVDRGGSRSGSCWSRCCRTAPNTSGSITNLERQDLTYSLFDIPLVLIGLVAWSRRDRDRSIDAGPRFIVMRAGRGRQGHHDGAAPDGTFGCRCPAAPC